MTHPPDEPNHGRGAAPRAVPANGTPPSVRPRIGPQPGAEPASPVPPQGIPQQVAYPQDRYPQSGSALPDLPRQTQSGPALALGSGAAARHSGAHPGNLGPLSLSLAPWRARVVAAVIDVLVMSPLLVFGTVVFSRSFKPGTYDARGMLLTVGGPTGSGIGTLLLCFAGAFGVNLWQLYRQGSTGQTLGKKFVGIRVLKRSNLRPTGFRRAFVRALAHLFDLLPFGIGYLAPLWDHANRTVADRLTGTIVIRG